MSARWVGYWVGTVIYLGVWSWLTWKIHGRLLHSWWRWLCCRTGHHRETVETTVKSRLIDVSHSVYGSWGTYDFCPTVIARCLDCGEVRVIMQGAIPSPSRRYALRGKA